MADYERNVSIKIIYYLCTMSNFFDIAWRFVEKQQTAT
jgi:hypothetical protein